MERILPILVSMLGKCNYKCIILINSAIVNSALAIGSWRPHFDDESWRGSDYAFFLAVLRPKKYSVFGQHNRYF